ncbi:MAG: Holliday junction resolvase RuvX [Candidatus Omnitrophota bacterium]
MRIMGLDLGTKNIGVAVSDESGTLAQGREVVRRTTDKEAIERIEEILKDFSVEEIVVGLPINMDGTMGERAADSERFAEMLKERTHLPVKLWDERLSTKEAESVMLEADVTRSKRKKAIDKLAAQIILQSYLDSRK